MSLQMFGLARLGRDAELRYTPSGEAVCNLSLAFNIRVKGEKATQWVEGALWSKRAEALAPYLLKGTALAVTLEDVNLETFTKQGGEQSTKLVGRVSSVDLAGSPQQAERPAPAPPPPPKTKPAQSSGFSDMDDDIPF